MNYILVSQSLILVNIIISWIWINSILMLWIFDFFNCYLIYMCLCTWLWNVICFIIFTSYLYWGSLWLIIWPYLTIYLSIIMYVDAVLIDFIHIYELFIYKPIWLLYILFVINKIFHFRIILKHSLGPHTR